MISGTVYLKAKNLQKTGSFKVRGAFNKMANIKCKKQKEFTVILDPIVRIMMI